jgi:leucyl aminopeptidase (aminopeptidase T)
MSILLDIDAHPSVAIFSPRPADYFDPPPLVCTAMLQSDVNVLLTSTGLLHSPASAAAMSRGIPSICMDGGMTLEMFQRGAATADYHELRVFEHYACRNIYGADADRVRVTSPLGTDLTFSVLGRVFVPALPETGTDPFSASRFVPDESDENSLLSFVFPGGECTVAPIEGSGNGICVIDLTMHHVNRLSGPVTLEIEDGHIVSIDGGADAQVLRRHLEQYGDANATCFPSEAAIGINRDARVTGCQREDKCIFGTMHFGLGTNIDVGGRLRSRIHIDGVMQNPTLSVDGEARMKDGAFLVPLDKPL